jgi:hypothetical protein
MAELKISESCDGGVVRTKLNGESANRIHVWSDCCQVQGGRFV